MGRLLAVSTLLLTMPSATDSHVSPKVIMARTPIAPIQSSAPAVGGSPRAARHR